MAISPFISNLLFGPMGLPGTNVGTPPYFPGQPGSGPQTPPVQPQQQPQGFFNKADQFLQRPGGNFLMNLLAQDGYSTMPGSPLGAVGRAGVMTQQQGQQQQMSEMQRKLIESQIGRNQQLADKQDSPFGSVDPSKFTQDSIRRFERSRDYGDLELREDSGMSPAAVQEFKFYQGLPEDQKAQYLRVKRSQPFANVAGAGYGAPDPVTGEFQPSVPESTIVDGEGQRALAKGEGARGRVQDPQGGFQAVPGTQAAIDQEADTRARGKGSQMTSIQAQTVVEDIGRLNNMLDDVPFGRSAAVQQGLTPALQSDAYRNASSLIESVKGNVGVDSLLRIKASGAGLGQVPQSQLDLLSRLLGELNMTQDKEQFVQTWNRMGRVYNEIWSAADDDMRNLGLPPPEVFTPLNRAKRSSIDDIADKYQ